MPKHQPDTNSTGHSRRGFLARLGVGMAAVAAAFLPLGLSRDYRERAFRDQFPGKDSIFHPAKDPRLDPRRNKTP